MATPILVELEAAAVQAALALADASFQRNAYRRGGREQYANTPKSHKVGKVGEVACSSALVQNGIAASDNFRDPSREGEILSRDSGGSRSRHGAITRGLVVAAVSHPVNSRRSEQRRMSWSGAWLKAS